MIAFTTAAALTHAAMITFTPTATLTHTAMIASTATATMIAFTATAATIQILTMTPPRPPAISPGIMAAIAMMPTITITIMSMEIVPVGWMGPVPVIPAGTIPDVISDD
jgi:hypothetical protein